MSFIATDDPPLTEEEIALLVPSKVASEITSPTAAATTETETATATTRHDEDKDGNNDESFIKAPFHIIPGQIKKEVMGEHCEHNAFKIFGAEAKSAELPSSSSSTTAHVFRPRKEVHQSLLHVGVITLIMTVTSVFMLHCIQRFFKKSIKIKKRSDLSNGNNNNNMPVSSKSNDKAQANNNHELYNDNDAGGRQANNGMCSHKPIPIKKLTYIIMHMCINICISSVGMYHYVQMVGESRSTSLLSNNTLANNHDGSAAATTVPSQILKTCNFDQYTILGELQLSYQLWTIPASFLLSPESASMMIHHLSVVLLSTVVTFLRNGWRYYAPFFFGVVEITSVPLGIVNIFKTMGVRSLTLQYRGLYQVIKVVFGVSFLLVRVILWLPQMYDFQFVILGTLKECGGSVATTTVAAGTSTTNNSSNYYCYFCKAFMVTILLCSTFLTLLQWYWGGKIILIFLRMFGYNNNNRKKKPTFNEKEMEEEERKLTKKD